MRRGGAAGGEEWRTGGKERLCDDKGRHGDEEWRGGRDSEENQERGARSQHGLERLTLLSLPRSGGLICGDGMASPNHPFAPGRWYPQWWRRERGRDARDTQKERRQREGETNQRESDKSQERETTDERERREKRRDERDETRERTHKRTHERGRPREETRERADVKL